MPMKCVEIERFCYSDEGTFGWLTTPSGARYFTVERPWLNNQREVSCIPLGVYFCGPRRFNRGGYEAIEIKQVPSRDHILMHIANLPNHVQGCIGINTKKGSINGKWSGLGSTKAFNKLMAEIGSIDFKLSITNRKAGEL